MADGRSGGKAQPPQLSQGANQIRAEWGREEGGLEPGVLGKKSSEALAAQPPPPPPAHSLRPALSVTPAFRTLHVESHHPGPQFLLIAKA